MRRSRTRKAVFYGITLLLVYGAVEVVSLLAYAVVAEDAFSFSQLQGHRSAVIEVPAKAPTPAAQGPAGARPQFLDRQVVHPYIGYIQDPEQAGNAYGFTGPPPPVGRGGASDTVVVAVLGGSVAQGLLRARQPLSDALQEIASFSGKEILIVNLALGGMKQPQQLMAVNFFMSLGARFDVVVNLDGFNEIVLPIVENKPEDTVPYYPRMWKARVADLGDFELLRRAGRIAHLESARQQAARFFSGRPLRYSVTANVFWYLFDYGLVRWIDRNRVNLTVETRDAPDGSRQPAASEEALYADLAAYWKQSSLLLHHLARSSGFSYFHFLQPSQHVPGNKILTEQERALAQAHGYRPVARAGYPYLIEAGKELIREGVAYTDLTMLFAGHDEALYSDGCCHLNQRGNEMMAREIAQVIREKLEAR